MKARILLLIVLTYILPACIPSDEIQDQVVEVIAIAEKTSLTVNESSNISASLKNNYNHTFPDKAGKITWQSSAPAIVSIDAQGIAKGLLRGQAEISATYGGIVSNKLLFTIVNDPNEVASIEVGAAGASTLAPGATLQLTATAKNVEGNLINGLTFSWESSNTAVAEVNANGLLTAKSNGLTNIRAMSAGKNSANFPVMVGSIAGKSGTFTGSNGYSVSGAVSLAMQPNGALALMLGADFRAQNGPGLYVYLSNSRQNAVGGLELEKLRKNSGADTYAVPASVSIDDYKFAMILCKPFNIPFGVAELK